MAKCGYRCTGFPNASANCLSRASRPAMMISSLHLLRRPCAANIAGNARECKAFMIPPVLSVRGFAARIIIQLSTITLSTATRSGELPGDGPFKFLQIRYGESRCVARRSRAECRSSRLPEDHQLPDRGWLDDLRQLLSPRRGDRRSSACGPDAHRSRLGCAIELQRARSSACEARLCGAEHRRARRGTKRARQAFGRSVARRPSENSAGYKRSGQVSGFTKRHRCAPHRDRGNRRHRRLRRHGSLRGTRDPGVGVHIWEYPSHGEKRHRRPGGYAGSLHRRERTAGRRKEHGGDIFSLAEREQRFSAVGGTRDRDDGARPCLPR